MKQINPRADILLPETDNNLPEYPQGEKLNDLKIRLAGIPFFGLLVPNVSGLITLRLYSVTEIVFSHLYFIFIAACIWQGNRFLLFRLRQRHSWLNNPFQKIVSLFMANLLYTVPLTVGLCWIWYAWLGRETINWNVITSVTLMCVICVIFITHVYEMVFLAKNWEVNKQVNEKLQITLNKYLVINNPPAPPVIEEKATARTRFLAKKGLDYTFITSAQVAYFYTLDKIVFAISNEGERLVVDHTLTQLEHLLPATDFYRVNRQYLININAIQKFRPSYKGKLVLKVINCTDELVISQENAAQFKQWIES